MKKQKLRYMCFTGIFTAVVFVFTAYLHFPSHTGYTHVGDGFIYLAATLLPLPYAVFVGAVGALLADLLTGYAVWAPASVVIKALGVLFFSRKGRTVTKRNVLALFPASLLCIGGYYLYEALLLQNFTTPLLGVIGYVTQSVLSAALFMAAGAALDKTKLKEFIQNGENRR